MNLLGSFDMFMAICDDAGIIISLFIFIFIYIYVCDVSIYNMIYILLIDSAENVLKFCFIILLFLKTIILFNKKRCFLLCNSNG